MRKIYEGFTDAPMTEYAEKFWTQMQNKESDYWDQDGKHISIFNLIYKPLSAYKPQTSKINHIQDFDILYIFIM